MWPEDSLKRRTINALLKRTDRQEREERERRQGRSRQGRGRVGRAEDKGSSSGQETPLIQLNSPHACCLNLNLSQKKDEDADEDADEDENVAQSEIACKTSLCRLSCCLRCLYPCLPCPALPCFDQEKGSSSSVSVSECSTLAAFALISLPQRELR